MSISAVRLVERSAFSGTELRKLKPTRVPDVRAATYELLPAPGWRVLLYQHTPSSGPMRWYGSLQLWAPWVTTPTSGWLDTDVSWRADGEGSDGGEGSIVALVRTYLRDGLTIERVLEQTCPDHTQSAPGTCPCLDVSSGRVWPVAVAAAILALPDGPRRLAVSLAGHWRGSARQLSETAQALAAAPPCRPRTPAPGAPA